MLFDKLAQSVLELPGVQGLCLADAGTATLLYNRMPDFIPEFAFETALRRVASLYETTEASLQPVDDFVLKFRGNSLVLRRSGGVFLILLLTESAHLVSLRIVTNIVLKNTQANPAILAELRSAQAALVTTAPIPETAVAAESHTTATERPGAPPSAAPVPAAASKPRRSLRVYRGVVIGSE